MSDIETIKMLLGNKDISDEFVAFFLNDTEQWILGYCNITSLPKQLKPTLLEITAYKVKANTDGPNIALGKGIRQVASLSDGNQSIGFSTTGAKSMTSEEEILASFSNILNRFRRMVVNKPTKPTRNELSIYGR